jgi:hypothetical protein
VRRHGLRSRGARGCLLVCLLLPLLTFVWSLRRLAPDTSRFTWHSADGVAVLVTLAMLTALIVLCLRPARQMLARRCLVYSGSVLPMDGGDESHPYNTRLALVRAWLIDGRSEAIPYELSELKVLLPPQRSRALQAGEIVTVAVTVDVTHLLLCEIPTSMLPVMACEP